MPIKAGWLSDVNHLASPNFNQRPVDQAVTLLVIHNISLPPGKFGTGCVQQFFKNELDSNADPYFEQIKDLKVSAHCLIERDGQITQFVSFDDRAWHAGLSEFCGVADCNNYSIGIELEGTDELAYTDAQYTQLAWLTALLQVHYTGINLDRIVGHCDIAPGRKTDPGPAFGWSKYRALIK